MLHLSPLLVVCLLPLGVSSAVLPRQSPEPNCNPTCPPPIIAGYANVWSGTFYGVLNCEVGPDDEYWIECSYNSDGTRNDDNSYPADECPLYATCSNERRRSNIDALPRPARRTGTSARDVAVLKFAEKARRDGAAKRSEYS
ncbi:hypothetical protein CALVIDRAFT_541079 [Calocera viscosa TUFC12733]|uniref:Uncharacterized protein n=1 Tax=Calocera viscosa (strain TUFC12733) TaxID=1330018 RepID=A0A167I3H0_CALVF|nr:hypothetical protein CALVIDRAFT_541079 [Calocera viscosa TUFC12733]